MAIFYEAEVPIEALNAFVRELPMDSNLGLSNLFPTEFHDDNKVSFAELTRTNRVAQYRSFDGRVHVSSRDGASEGEIGLLPLSSSLNMGEYERLQLEFARTGGTNVRLMENAIYRDAEQLVGEVRNRVELAWGDVLSDGVLTIAEGGLGGTAGTLDFGVPGDQKVTVTTGWSDPDAGTPLSDLQAIVDAYVDRNGFAPGGILTPNVVQRRLRRSKEIIEALYGTTSGRNNVRMDEVADLLSSELQGIDLLLPYDSSFSVNGVTTRTLPADKVILLPPNVADLGHTAYGVTVTALELMRSTKVEFSFEDAPGIVGIVNKSDGIPFRQDVQVDAVAMPVLTRPELLAIVDSEP